MFWGCVAMLVWFAAHDSSCWRWWGALMHLQGKSDDTAGSTRAEQTWHDR
jgi:hypothetical protein